MDVNIFMVAREAEFLRAMWDRTRLMILHALSGGERCACELPEIVGRSQPTVSLQLAYLARLGLVRCRKAGKKRLYSIADRRVRKILEVME